MYRSRKIAVILALLFSFGFAQAADARPTITEIVLKSGAPGEFDKNRYDYDILLTAVVTAGLADALNNPDAQAYRVRTQRHGIYPACQGPWLSRQG